MIEDLTDLEFEGQGALMDPELEASCTGCANFCLTCLNNNATRSARFRQGRLLYLQ